MREVPLSTSEKTFIVECIKQNRRLDGRGLKDFRDLKINFGSEWGSAHVSLGETRVLAQISCELGQPKATRPNEGLLYINIELGPMAAIHFEAGRNSELTVQINRTLERTLKDSRCVDLESLCVLAEDKVWILRVDLTVLNHEGNIIDCASVAALTALAHFKRPDVSIAGEEIKVHTSAEKDPLPIVLHHYPVCVSYATFKNGEIAVADPTVIEERTSEANMIFGLNSYRELCCLNLGGTTLTSSNLLLKCSNRAANRAKEVVEQIKKVLAEDTEARAAGKSVGFTECVRLNKITSLAQDRISIKLSRFNYNLDEDFRNPDVKMEDTIDGNENKISVDGNTGILGSNQKNIEWMPQSSDSEQDDYCESDSSMVVENELRAANLHIKERTNQPISKTAGLADLKQETSSDSEEDATMILK